MIAFKKNNPKILVVGDLIIDQYLWGTCDRISPEAPVQVITIQNENMVLGGAGNVINNLHSLHAEVDVISVIGECDASIKLNNLLSKINIDTKYLVTQNDRITSMKSRIISAQQQVVRFDRESVIEINNESQEIIIQTFKKIVNNYDVVLLSDYGKGVLTSNLTQSLISIANQNSKKILVDPKGLDFSKYKGAYLMTPNKKEACAATNIDIKDTKSLTNALIRLKDQCNLKLSLITLSDEGVAIFDHELRIYPTVAREVYDVTGAGDTVLASLGFALSCNKDIDEAVKFANLASGVVVGKIGSATATLDEIIEYESSLKRSSGEAFIKTSTEISSIVKSLKTKGRKIVFTNGCFDILHVGHVKYLEAAKNLGDILILGLNSDNSVRRIKGKNRPINNQNDRAYILASLEIIDYVVIFDEDTPIDLIQTINPDILTKGGDYKNQKVVGEDFAKELKIIDFIDGKSTTITIKKIQSL
jgi:D-beta-D-heptose 7-phosphate kinase / D-beta-D-heptose 1-phosphate adenosyltransferase